MALYKIADMIVEMSPNFERVRRNAEPYLFSGDGKADFTCDVSEKSVLRVLKDNPHLSADECEYILYGSKFYKLLIEHGGIMLHSSAVAVDGRAYLFSADSGTGKSTHTTLWKELLGDRACIINDDKPAIRKIGGEYFVYGTPFSGKDDINLNMSARLGAVCFIERGAVNSIEKIAPAGAVSRLLRQTLRPYREDAMDTVLGMVDGLLRGTDVYLLKCNMSLDAAKLSYSVLSGENIQ